MTLIFRSRLLIATSFPKEQPPLIVSRQYHRTPIRGTVMPSSARSEGVRQPFIARQMDDGARLPAPATWWRVGLAVYASVPSLSASISSCSDKEIWFQLGRYNFAPAPVPNLLSRSFRLLGLARPSIGAIC